MSKIAVLGDSGVGKTTWLYSMTGQVPLNVYRSTQTEIFYFTETKPHVPFVGVHGHADDAHVAHMCAGCDGAIVLYRHPHTPLAWLTRLQQLFPGEITSNFPIIVCCHGTTCSNDTPLRWRRWFPSAEHYYTCKDNRMSILDCANRIIFRSRHMVASPLGDG